MGIGWLEEVMVLVTPVRQGLQAPLQSCPSELLFGFSRSRSRDRRRRRSRSASRERRKPSRSHSRDRHRRHRSRSQSHSRGHRRFSRDGSAKYKLVLRMPEELSLGGSPSQGSGRLQPGLLVPLVGGGVGHGSSAGPCQRLPSCSPLPVSLVLFTR